MNWRFFSFFFESIPAEERTSLLTLYNVIHTAAWVGGAMLGGAILYTMDTSKVAYLWVFAGSAMGRCLALLLLAGLARREVAADAIGVRSIAVRPNEGALDAVVLPSLPDQTSAIGQESQATEQEDR